MSELLRNIHLILIQHLGGMNMAIAWNEKRDPKRNDKTKVYVMNTSTIYSRWILQTVVDGNSSQSSVTECRLINLKEIWTISKKNSFHIFFSIKEEGSHSAFHNCIDDQNSNPSSDQSFVGIGRHLEQRKLLPLLAACSAGFRFRKEE